MTVRRAALVEDVDKEDHDSLDTAHVLRGEGQRYLQRRQEYKVITQLRIPLEMPPVVVN